MCRPGSKDEGSCHTHPLPMCPGAGEGLAWWLLPSLQLDPVHPASQRQPAAKTRPRRSGEGPGRARQGELGAQVRADSPEPSLTLCAEPVLAAVGGAAVQLVAGGTSPELPRALTVPLHAGPVATAIRRLAAGLVHTHHGGHTSGTAPHVVLAARGQCLKRGCSADHPQPASPTPYSSS